MRATSSLLAAGLIAFAMLGGCARLPSHQGYIVDADLVNSVQPGVDNRDSVLQTLGRPSFASQFAGNDANGSDWYYLARESRSYGFQTPRAKSQLTLQISFDRNGTVSGIRRGSAEQIASVDPWGKTTPTLGRNRSFFSELFGNIGTVGSGLGGAAGGDPGGRDTP